MEILFAIYNAFENSLQIQRLKMMPRTLKFLNNATNLYSKLTVLSSKELYIESWQTRRRTFCVCCTRGRTLTLEHLRQSTLYNLQIMENI